MHPGNFIMPHKPDLFAAAAVDTSDTLSVNLNGSRHFSINQLLISILLIRRLLCVVKDIFFISFF